MDKRKLTGIIMCGVGIIMFVLSLSLLSVYSWIAPLMIKKFAFSLFFRFSGWPSSLVIALIVPISGITLIIFSLFSILLGLSFFPIITASITGITLGIFSLFSVSCGLNFFRPDFHFQLYLLLILVSGLIYFLSSIFIFRLKNWARKIVIIYSLILICYFVSFSMYLFSDPSGWGGALIVSLLPYIIYPFFFIIFFTRPKIKEQFKK